MADGHPSSCDKATLGSVCHCECSGVRHSHALLGALLGALPDVKAPSAAKAPAGKDAAGDAVDDVGPAKAAAPAKKAAPSFDDRASKAAQGDAARDAAPLSIMRGTGLSSDEEFSLGVYKGQTYMDINHVLRGGDPDVVPRAVPDWINDIDAAMDRSKLTGDIQVWRGLGDGRRVFGGDERFRGNLTGYEWREDAYSSTSSDEYVSRGFASSGVDPDDVEQSTSVLVRMIVPKGVGGIELSGDEYESEVLLQKGLRMRVVQDRGQTNGLRLLDVEVLPPE